MFKGHRNAQGEFTYVRTYSRWREDDRRRERYPETVDRYIDFIMMERGADIPSGVIERIYAGMLDFATMPSMRMLWAAGDAMRVDNATGYNCSFLAINDPAAFWEALYILMCGTGVGFSVERKFVNKLPSLPTVILPATRTKMVEDSRRGWADSQRELLLSLWAGRDLEFDYSAIRAKGTRLKTMGGRASGPEPLVMLHEFTRELFYNAVGRKLTPIECHDLLNQTGESVVVGGVRRSSEISISDLDDAAMRSAKDWPFPRRRNMANNSAVYSKKPSPAEFMREWAALIESGTGERGIFNLYAARKNAPGRRDASRIIGTNPCSEIQLRDMEFCNLSEVVARADDDVDTLLSKIETATWIGAIQSTFTHFPYLRPEWTSNCNEERLLGVSITGQMDAPHLFSPELERAYKSRALRTAAEACTQLGINMSAAVTCGKPSGTVSQLVDSASGMHPRYAKYYARRYRISDSDPLLRMLEDQGMRSYKAPETDNTYVVEFPVAAPTGAITRNDVSALDQLDWYLRMASNYCEHNQSCTIYYDEAEALRLGAAVYDNFDRINGVAFLPRDGGKYELAPYQELTRREHEELAERTPVIDYTRLSDYEFKDGTSSVGSYACTGDRCELADMGA